MGGDGGGGYQACVFSGSGRGFWLQIRPRVGLFLLSGASDSIFCSRVWHDRKDIDEMYNAGAKVGYFNVYAQIVN